MLARRDIPQNARVDHLLIAEMVAPGARVLDVGCGDGALLQLLTETKDVDGRGIEIAREKVNACVARGLSVIQGNADLDLDDYPDNAFDYAILSLTIQATLRPKPVLQNLLRIGRRAIVSFPNFGHWRVRTRLLVTGRMPVTENLPDAWHETPNAQCPFVHDQGFRGPVSRRRCQGRARRRIQRMGPAARHVGAHAADGAQSARRESGVPADAQFALGMTRTTAPTLP